MNFNRIWQQQPTTWKPEIAELNILGDWTYQMANQFPAYSGTETPCIKCGHNQAATRYKSAYGLVDQLGNIVRVDEPEYLERTCLNCEYAWKEQTIDTPFEIVPSNPGFVNHVVSSEPELAGMALTEEERNIISGIASEIADSKYPDTPYD